MSTAPPPWDPAEDPDEQYRRASALDPSRPSEATRHAVLAHAARLAAARARADTRRRWVSLAGIAQGWRPALAGTLAAAVLAGVLIAPQLMTPRPLQVSESGAAPPLADAARKLEAVRPTEAVHPVAAAPARPAGPEEQRVVVTASRRAPAQRVESAPVASADVAAAVNSPVEPAASGGAVSREALAEVVVAPAAPAPATAGSSAARAVAPVRFEPSRLERAASEGDLATLDAQLRTGGNPDVRDAHGRTPLLIATLSKQKDAVALLLAHGADPNATDENATTPLAAAIAAGEPQIADLLRRYGAR
jgi:hypothetical protein